MVGECGRYTFVVSGTAVKITDRKKNAPPGCSYSFGSKKPFWNGDKRGWKAGRDMSHWVYPKKCQAGCANEGDFGILCTKNDVVSVQGRWKRRRRMSGTF